MKRKDVRFIDFWLMRVLDDALYPKLSLNLLFVVTVFLISGWLSGSLLPSMEASWQ